MASDVEIVNVALRALGANRITSLSDGTKNANVADDIYTFVRDQVLRSATWGFATSRQQLSRLSDAPAFGFDYQYALPSDWLRTVSVHDSDDGMGTVVYKEETYESQRVLLANSDAIYLRYIARITDPALFTSDFTIAFAIELAKRMAVSIPNSNTIKADLENEVKAIILGAKSTDSAGSTPESRPPGSWVTARFGWPSNRWPR